jgi:hypothetical protein
LAWYKWISFSPKIYSLVWDKTWSTWRVICGYIPDYLMEEDVICLLISLNCSTSLMLERHLAALHTKKNSFHIWLSFLCYTDTAKVIKYICATSFQLYWSRKTSSSPLTNIWGVEQQLPVNLNTLYICQSQTINSPYMSIKPDIPCYEKIFFYRCL